MAKPKSDKKWKSRLQDVIAKVEEAGEKIPAPVYAVAKAIFPRMSMIISAIESLREDEEITTFARQELLAVLEAMGDEMAGVTNRWKLDTNSESWITRNFRPIIGGVIVLNFLAMTWCQQADWTRFTVQEMQWWENNAYLVLAAYFGGRAVQKIIKEYKVK